MAITAKNAPYLFSGSMSYMARLETKGKARSTAATIKAQNMSARNIFICGLKYPNRVLNIEAPLLH